MSCSSKHKIAVQGVLGCMILLLGFWHIRYSYANKLNNKACTMADSEKAMRTIEKAIKLNPMNPVYYANMGLLYAATDTAINLRNYMALSKVSSEALDKSLAYFHLANNMAPKNRLFSLNLGLLYALNGKYLKAKSFFEKAVENSDEEENVLLWALFCESHKQFVEAKRAFVKALIIAPYLLETDIYAKLEKHNYCYWIEIVENVVKILSVRKGDPINMAKLGSVLLYKGDKIEAEKLDIAKVIFDQLSGTGITLEDIIEAKRKVNPDYTKWEKEDFMELIRNILHIAKPMLIVANKADLPTAEENIKRMQEKYPYVIPASAESEIALVKAAEAGLISYTPGDSDFEILEKDKLSDNQLKALEYIKVNILEKYGGTGIQTALNEAIFGLLNMIVVYPVQDEHKYTDQKGNVLPDGILVPKGAVPKELAYLVHSDIGDNFMHAVDARKNMRIAADYELQDKDVISIVTRG